MRISRVQFTVRGMMVAVAVIAADCFVFVMTDGGGVLLIELLLNVGFVRWWRTQGKHRRFWGGFVAAGLGAVLAFIGCIYTLGTDFALWPMNNLMSIPQYLPTAAGEWFDSFVARQVQSQLIFAIMFFEVGFGLPMLLFALIGGLLSAFIWPQRVPRSAPALSAAAEA
jgi:hypothetical protein